MTNKYDIGYVLFISAVIMLMTAPVVTANEQTKPIKDLLSSVHNNINYMWEKTDSSIALLYHENIVWKFNYPEYGKPFFHPVNTTDGIPLTWFAPPDHPWHRGLWFSWKYINGLNYWEQDRSTGLSEGFTHVKNIIFNPNPDFSARIQLEIEYAPPDKPAVLTEKRILKTSIPDENGNYYIDWKSTFTAGEDSVVLGRTPVLGQSDGVSWGGYAGLGCRIDSRSLSSIKFWDSEGRQDLDIHSKPARWINVSGLIKEVTTQSAGIVIFDHPKNPRYPPPGFVIKNWLEDYQLLFAYLNPGFLFEKRFTLEVQESLILNYRILIHRGQIDSVRLEKEFERFIGK